MGCSYRSRYDYPVLSGYAVLLLFIILNTADDWSVAEFVGTINEASDYLNIIMMFEIGLCVAFQLPLVIFYLAILHLVPHGYVSSGASLCWPDDSSAVVTPDASPAQHDFDVCSYPVAFSCSVVARYVIKFAMAKLP